MIADNQAGKIQYDKDKAYLFGAYLGDGCCSKYSGYCFRIVSGDKDIIERTSLIVEQLIRKKSKIREIKPNNTLLFDFQAFNKDLFMTLTSLTDKKSKIPEFILGSDKEIVLEFVAALMDTDGYISAGINKFGQQRFSLGFVNSAEWMDQFISLLRNFGVKVGKKTLKGKFRSVNEKDCYQININLRSFVEHGFYFYCQRKQSLLERYKTNVKYQSY